MMLFEWLAQLENESRDMVIDEVILWGGSVGFNMQAAVTQMYGVSDVEDKADSRPSQIVRAIKGIVADAPFSILDICCGDGFVLKHIMRSFADVGCFGIDTNKGNTQAYRSVIESGVHIFRVPMQRLFESAPPKPLDFTMMLNTYRGWDAAKLRDNERELPAIADAWLSASSRFSILTATDIQIDTLSKAHRVRDIGKGEQNSRMILVEWGIG
jgi:SAM-dependent methyltransferase